MIGKTILHYKILEKLGEGGMGVVYKAHDTKLDRFVALKFLPKGIEADDSERARFLQEAKAASALSHPNVCIIYDIQEEDDEQFIVMEYVDGVTLRQKIVGAIHESPLKLKDIIEWAIQIGDALQAAHSKGIIHRDVKSDNIMINTANQIKVMDFGLAKLKGSLKLTKTSSTVGTLAYMAPEQLKGEKTDARMDIFSFGVVFYEMLTGHLPFKGEYESALMYSILNTEPEPVTKYRPELSSGFLFLLDKALEKEPDERYQSISDTLVDLRRLKRDTSKVSRKPALEMPPIVQAEEPAPAVPVAPYKKFVGAIGKSPLIYVGSAVLVILLIIVGYLLWRGRGGPTVPKFTNATRITQAIGVEDYPTWSPDGGRLAYHSNQSGNFDIWVTQLEVGSPVNLTKDYTGDDVLPTWSPDGSQIAFLSARDGGGYYVMSALGSIEGKVAKVAVTDEILTHMGPLSTLMGPPQWSPNGKELACVVYDSSGRFIEIVSLQTGTSRRLRLLGERFKSELSWSPDGRYFAYVSDMLSRKDPTSRLWVLREADGEGFPITDGKTWDWSPQWSHDGRTLYYVSNRGGIPDLWQQRIGDDGRPMGSPQQVTSGLEIQYAKFSPDGKKLAYSKGKWAGNVWRVPIPPSGKKPATWADAHQLTFEQASLTSVELSPDGKWLVFDSERDGLPHLWMMPVEGGEMRRVTQNPMPQIWPTWSSDGREIAFESVRGANFDIWATPVDGGPAHQVTNYEKLDADPAWSPDGKEIAFKSGRSGNNDIWVIPAQGGEARQLTVYPSSENEPDWSPDGQWIIFLSNRTGDWRLWKIPAKGGSPIPMTEGGVTKAGVWSPDGRKVYFRANREGADNFWEVSAEGGKERQLTDFMGKPGNFPTWSKPTADGKYIYFTWSDELADIWVMDVEETK